jgi:serine protease inhibitor
MTRVHRIAAGVAAATTIAALASGCGTGTAVPSKGPGAAEPIANIGQGATPAAFGASDAAFGLNVLSAWCASTPDANIVLSPVSLASGLGMAYLGARGSTAGAMASVLDLPAAPGPALVAGLRARSQALRDLDGPGVTVTDTDRLWTDTSVDTLPGYRSEIATGYGARLTSVPMMSDPDLAAREINAAIATATHGHITNLVEPDSLQDIGWLLTDAMYLDAKWANPFNPAQTSTGEFTTAAGSAVQASYLEGGQFATVSEDGWRAVALPYQGSRLEMLALLPPRTAARACQDLPAATLAGITANLRAARPGVAVDLPKVSLSSKGDMVPLLRRLGMGVAFGLSANFLGIGPNAGFIALVEHAATLKVDEQGTVGSAATAVGLMPTSLEITTKVINFNRPYLMVVVDRSTGEPLFLARVANPDLP